MTKKFRAALFLWSCMVLVCSRAPGQARPTASAPGFALPTLGGSLRYSLSASELLTTGLYSNGGLVTSTNLSGNLAFITPGVSHPLSLVYSGGYLFGNSGQPSPFFQNLTVSQRLLVERWSFTASDAVNYLPQSPTTGLSGIPGVGDVGLDPVGAPANLGILTNYGTRVTNSASLGASRQMTGALSVQATGNYTILRFLEDSSSNAAGTGSGVGIDNAATSISGGMGYRIDARNNAGASYSYSKSTYSGSSYAFTSQGVSGSYSRLWTRRLSTNISGGPVLISSPGAVRNTTSVNFSAAAGATLTGKELTTSLNYQHGVGNGSGVIQGSISDSLIASINRSYGRSWRLSGSLGYANTRSLPTLGAVAFSSGGETASVQASRSISRNTSMFASYTVANQSFNTNAAALNALNGIYQVVSFGLTYSPSAIRLGPQ